MSAKLETAQEELTFLANEKEALEVRTQGERNEMQLLKVFNQSWIGKYDRIMFNYSGD